MFFTLVIKNAHHPLVPPLVMEVHPITGDPMTLEHARYLATGMLEEYIKNNNLTGSATRRARSEVEVLQPQRYISLDGLHIELRRKSVIIDIASGVSDATVH